MTPGEAILSAIGGGNKEERVANVLDALSREGWAFVHTAQIGNAGAGPVGEADERAAFDGWWTGSGRKASYASVLYDQAAWVAWKERAARARPVKEPGEVERLVEETGSSSVDDLRDMALVGHSLMDVIGIATADGPYKDWTPAENPTEIVIDLINDLEEARKELAMTVGRHKVERTASAELNRQFDKRRETAEASLAESEQNAQGLASDLAGTQTELTETRERLEKERDAGFNHGYLMAVANIINLHRETVVAADVLLQIDLTIDDAESFELAEYDMEALNRLRAEPRAADFFKSQRRTGDAQEAGR